MGGGPGGVEDPSAFFAAVFGGDRFHDYVRKPRLRLVRAETNGHCRLAKSP